MSNISMWLFIGSSRYKTYIGKMKNKIKRYSKNKNDFYDNIYTYSTGIAKIPFSPDPSLVVLSSVDRPWECKQLGPYSQQNEKAIKTNDRSLVW